MIIIITVVKYFNSEMYIIAVRVSEQKIKVSIIKIACFCKRLHSITDTACEQLLKVGHFNDFRCNSTVMPQ